MAHRGRLNLLANVMRKPLTAISPNSRDFLDRNTDLAM